MVYTQRLINTELPALGQCLASAYEVIELLQDKAGNKTLPNYLKPLAPGQSVEEIQNYADEIIAKSSDVVVLGTGGSSLGAQALVSLKEKRFNHNHHMPRIHFPDNLGPYTMDALLAELDLSRTHFLVISKSGNTAETLAQLMACMAAYRDLNAGQSLSEAFTIIVQPGNSTLRRLANRWRLPILDHDAEIGGRYSILSNVGLLPAALAGLDVAAVREGANSVLQDALQSKEACEVPAVLGAAAIYHTEQKNGGNINVMMPYDCRLEMFARWHQQLWAESVGKQSKGTTPVRALGPVDQHSQLQLYLDGPNDKYYTFISSDTGGAGPVIDAMLASDPSLGYMAGRTVGDLVAAEVRATIEALTNHGRPIRHLKIKELDERRLGGLIMHFILETVIGAHLYGVNAFDQPAVEEGKKLTLQYMEWGRRQL
ncbi:MAG: glucose-6-phosphate isomerase [Kordiimonas sp.]|nr:glucose-6-phosphate isomerase [Kordiimonas sp.]|tara:strand:+ start:2721 stop:4004 length:1284 start_codon:yes stop_codon:yes gene_type:complete